MKNSGKYVKATAVFTLAFAASGMMLSGCRIDTKKLNDGLNDIGKIVKPVAEDVIPDGIWNKNAPTSVPLALPKATETPVPTATPEPTATPIPTPTPMPERVDFSELIKTDLGHNFRVSSEDFGESYTAEGGDTVISDFKGNRIAVEVKDNAAAQQAINLILNSYYLKAEGVYKETSARAASFFALNGAVDEPYHTEISFAHSDNGRILSVVIKTTVMQGSKTLRSETKVESFDMLTGQYVNLGTVSDRASRLKVALINELNKERLAVKQTEAGLKKSEAEEFLPSESSADETSETSDATDPADAADSTESSVISDGTDETSSGDRELKLADGTTGETVLTDTITPTPTPTSTPTPEVTPTPADKGKDKDKKKDTKDSKEDSADKNAADDKETEDGRNKIPSDRILPGIVNYSDVYIVIQTPGATSVTAQICGVTASGEVYTATCDLTPYKDLFNSYGKLVYGL